MDRQDKKTFYARNGAIYVTKRNLLNYGLFGGKILLVGFMLLVTALLLLLADKAKNTKKEVSYLYAILIGISQAIAIIPGISRSGATISTSVLLGIDRTRAAKFYFLMVVPLFFGKIGKYNLIGELILKTSETTDERLRLKHYGSRII